MNMKGCERCKTPTGITTGSWFNQEMICLECNEKERAHPAFETAKQAEREAVLQGNYNFVGIGKPQEL
jgi:recombinational DNA repair protein (RecF pathway)